MRWVYFLCLLFVLMAIGLSIISCTQLREMNFVCNDIFDSTLTLEKKADILKKCSEGQLMWRKTF